MKIRVIWFKQSGKYYGEGTFDCDCEDFEIGDKFKELLATGERPGLVPAIYPNSIEFDAVISGELEVPRLMRCADIVPARRSA